MLHIKDIGHGMIYHSVNHKDLSLIFKITVEIDFAILTLAATG